MSIYFQKKESLLVILFYFGSTKCPKFFGIVFTFLFIELLL